VLDPLESPEGGAELPGGGLDVPDVPPDEEPEESLDVPPVDPDPPAAASMPKYEPRLSTTVKLRLILRDSRFEDEGPESGVVLDVSKEKYPCPALMLSIQTASCSNFERLIFDSLR